MLSKKYIKIKRRDIVFLLISVVSFFIGIIMGSFGKGQINNLNPNNAKAMSIFINNFLVGISIMFIGSITGGVYGVSALFINGYIVGKLVRYLVDTNATKYILTGIMPHIWLELLGLIIFSIIGFYPIYELIHWMKKGKLSSHAKYILAKIFLMFCFGSVFLLLAAIIESYVSTVA